MVFTDHLKKENIIIATRSKSRWALIEELVDTALHNGEIAAGDRDEILNALVDREKSMSTGIGNGVAIPHCTTPRVEEMVILLAMNQKGIDFDAIDSSPVKIIILLLVPKNKLTQHIKTLANIARTMNDAELRALLLQQKTPESVLELLASHKGA
jgi:fructose-specific phosphotransferase system IIA component